MWATVGLAGVAGLASYTVAAVGAKVVSERLDPSLSTWHRNNYIAGGVLLAVGAAVAIYGHPLVGAAVAGGAIAAAAGPDVTGYLALALQPRSGPPPAMSGVLAGDRQIAGILASGQQRMINGVLVDDRQLAGVDSFSSAGGFEHD